MQKDTSKNVRGNERSHSRELVDDIIVMMETAQCSDTRYAES